MAFSTPPSTREIRELEGRGVASWAPMGEFAGFVFVEFNGTVKLNCVFAYANLDVCLPESFLGSGLTT